MVTIKIIKNISFLLLFSILCSTLVYKYRGMSVEGAAYTAVISVIIEPTPTQIPPVPPVTSVPTSIPLPTLSSTTSQPPKPPIASVITIISGSDLINKLNDYRRSKGLAEVVSDGKSCEFAKVRVGEIVSNFSHEGFEQRLNSNSLPYPSYSNVVENIAQVASDKNVIEMWMNSPSHRENMEKDTPYVCIEQQGDFYVYEGWKP